MDKHDITRDPDEHPVDHAARVVGGRAQLAEQLGVTVAAIGNWKHREVPIEKCPKIELITAGQVTRIDLRPDDWADIWPELAEAQANTAPVATETVAEQGA
jgi:DNA-binding transcriptional regulator YdaS (Cro superfamily)